MEKEKARDTMKRRSFLGKLSALPLVVASPSLAARKVMTEGAKIKPSRWLKLLDDQNFDLTSPWHPIQSKIKVVNLAGAMLSIIVIDRMLAELSGDVSVKLFPQRPWAGCHILSVPFHLSSYMLMRYELTAEKNNAELDRAHEGAIWTIDHRIPNDVVLFESANGRLGLVRHVANYNA